NVVPHRWPGLKVQIFHGLGEEKPGHYRITGFFDLYCTPGPLVTQRFEARRRRKRHFLVRETGWPKLDSLAESIDIREAKSGLGLDPNRPLILYAPTFSPRYESASALLEPICSQAGSKYQWIVKFHDLMPANIRNSYQQRLGSAVLSAEHSDITPLLAAADVMITDTSSVAYEFLMLDRPIITYRAAARQDKGIDLQSPANLAEAIQRSLDDPAEFTLQRQEYLGQLHPYRDGQSARRVVQACEGIIANGEHLRLRRKPLNLWRRYQNRNLVR
ncbi:MAG: CDP-glycerol glycerophosphotransferase family protein, partial [Candidatus Marinimicrobia bacterium]|nr:CDP-glycerol glycerophosphotransferase family protein [Candidatus Neomarinimicrobiota bacterium]